MDKMPCNGWLKQTMRIYPSMHFIIRNSDEYAYLKEKISS
jgi:hypothetical protein